LEDTAVELFQEKILQKLTDQEHTLQDTLQRILLVQDLQTNVKFNLVMQ
jgi:uncharacterized protein YeeX (DUF496 family)